MFATNVSFWVAFGAGILSFFSPCILPLIPVYFMYITESTIESQLLNQKKIVLTRTIGFVIGFTIIFILMGATATFIGKIFVQNKSIFSKISGLLIIIFGLNMMGIIKFNFLQIEKKVSEPRVATSWFSSILVGMAFAAGWTPCFGPILASILIFAGSSETMLKGILLLLIYSIGMAIPFIVTALFINYFRKFIKKSRKFLIFIPKISGAIMVIFGFLVFFNKIINLSRLFV
ncbi:cytochrome c biogenesis CcdA family protein [Clostridium grantii]|uniref:Cytochrome c-type biogenesis protein n=1 Tax=Clostridium grantii DSM 8605 TaxID=1121316 RepID=A0A1M5UXX4_9CLOT|nr:cytochrome c biogenesis protein CcdA [Clostridium grantii]SHH67897.1 cytochrome c-type biogenesis protein [Clostridium grantii DSM 8605]